MSFYPLCQRPTFGADLIHMPYVYGQPLALTLKVYPDWKREAGMCRSCLENLVNTVAELEDMKAVSSYERKTKPRRVPKTYAPGPF